jgi:hypothetical protein
MGNSFHVNVFIVMRSTPRIGRLLDDLMLLGLPRQIFLLYQGLLRN